MSKDKGKNIFTLGLLGLTIGSNYFFIRTLDMGMNGAAIATMITLVLYNIFRLLFVYGLFHIHPFSVSVFKGIILGLAILFLLEWIPVISRPILDLAVRGSLLSLLFWIPILYTRTEPELNKAINKYLSMARIRYRFPV